MGCPAQHVMSGDGGHIPRRRRENTAQNKLANEKKAGSGQAGRSISHAMRAVGLRLGLLVITSRLRGAVRLLPSGLWPSQKSVIGR